VEALGGKWNEAVLEGMYRWFSEAFEYKEDSVQGSVAAGAGVDVKDTWWGKLLGLRAFLKADIKAGSKILNKTITKENRRLSELVWQCDTLVKEAKLTVREQLGRELVLAIEDLDKCSIAEAETVFIENPAPLASLSCKAVYTTPIFLFCSPQSSVLQADFSTVLIPMIKVTSQDGSPCEPGIEAIRRILECRMDVAALMEEDALQLAINKTGGV